MERPIQKRREPFWVIMLFWIVIGVVLFSVFSRSRKPKVDPQEIVDLLEACPAWDDPLFDEPDCKEKIVDTMAIITTYDLDSVRYGVNVFCCGKSTDFSALSKIYLLNRYIFDVPEKVPLSAPRFWSLGPIPADSRFLGEMWPWEKDSEGNMKLISRIPPIILGMPPEPVEEFDYFRDTYGARKIVPSRRMRPDQNRAKLTTPLEKSGP